MFKPLTRSEIVQIVRLQLDMLSKTLATNDILLVATDAAVEERATMGFDPHFGARPLKRMIQKNILNELSKLILSGDVKKDSSITVDAKDGKIVFTNG